MDEPLELTCRDVADFLMAYLDQELEPAQHAAFEAHLGECDDCVRYLRSYQATVRVARAAYAEPAPPLPERLLHAIRAARKR
jgi:anti-sigma factor RsiW